MRQHVSLHICNLRECLTTLSAQKWLITCKLWIQWSIVIFGMNILYIYLYEFADDVSLMCDHETALDNIRRQKDVPQYVTADGPLIQSSTRKFYLN